MGLVGRGMDDPAKTYHDIEGHLRQTILDNGGSLSHHHGIGKLRSRFLPQIQTSTSMAILREAKRAIDPSDVFAIKNGVFALTEANDDAGARE